MEGCRYSLGWWALWVLLQLPGNGCLCLFPLSYTCLSLSCGLHGPGVPCVSPLSGSGVGAGHSLLGHLLPFVQLALSLLILQSVCLVSGHAVTTPNASGFLYGHVVTTLLVVGAFHGHPSFLPGLYVYPAVGGCMVASPASLGCLLLLHLQMGAALCPLLHCQRIRLGHARVSTPGGWAVQKFRPRLAAY